MRYQLKHITDPHLWQPLALDPHAPFTQSWFYGTWHEKIGEEVVRLGLYDQHKQHFVLFMQLYRCKAPHLGSYWSAPYGPVYHPERFSAEAIADFATQLKAFAKETSAFFVRLDVSPSPIDSPLSPKHLSETDLQKYFTRVPWYAVHGACFQPRREWVLPLKKSEEELLAGMHQKTRYNIRLSSKKGVTFEIVSENLTAYRDLFYELQKDTAKRNGFSLHPKAYYDAALESAEKEKAGFLVLARHEGEVLTANFVVTYGPIAMFAYGGSRPYKRNLMASYGAHWAGICHSKKLGLAYYNFGGYFDEDGPRVKPETLTKRARFSVFKRKFGGFVWEHAPLYDMVACKGRYQLYRWYKRLRHV